MKLTKDGYKIRLIDKTIDENLKFLAQLVLRDLSSVGKHGLL